MIKPIVYHSFEEKAKLEKELMAQIPYEKRKALAKELAFIFYNASREKSSANSSKASDEHKIDK